MHLLGGLGQGPRVLSFDLQQPRCLELLGQNQNGESTLRITCRHLTKDGISGQQMQVEKSMGIECEVQAKVLGGQDDLLDDQNPPGLGHLALRHRLAVTLRVDPPENTTHAVLPGAHAHRRVRVLGVRGLQDRAHRHVHLPLVPEPPRLEEMKRHWVHLGADMEMTAQKHLHKHSHPNNNNRPFHTNSLFSSSNSKCHYTYSNNSKCNKCSSHHRNRPGHLLGKIRYQPKHHRRKGKLFTKTLRPRETRLMRRSRRMSRPCG